MKAELKSKEKSVAKFEIVVDYNTFNEKVNEVYKKNRSYFTIPGFRRGKAPRSIVERSYGEGVFYENAINALIPGLFEEAVKDLELDPVSQPSVDVDEIKKGEDILLKFEVDLKPVPVVGDYSKLEVEIPKLEVTEEMVNQRIKEDLESNARIIEKDGAAENGDIVNIDYAGETDGEFFQGGTDVGHDLVLGSKAFIPGFEEQLIGVKKNDKVDVRVTFPTEYHAKELAGKEAVFHVTVNGIKGKEYPALDDEFAKDVSEFDTLDEYKKSIFEELNTQMDERRLLEKQNGVVKALVAVTKMDIPQSMVQDKVEEELHQLEHNLSSSGLTLAQYCQFMRTSEAALKIQMLPVAETKVAGDLALEKFVELEKIEVTDEEYEEEVNKLAKEYDKAPKELKAEIEGYGTSEILKSGIKRGKAIDKLVEMAKFVETKQKEEKEEDTVEKQ